MDQGFWIFKSAGFFTACPASNMIQASLRASRSTSSSAWAPEMATAMPPLVVA
jgi:hypothetical protein